MNLTINQLEELCNKQKESAPEVTKVAPEPTEMTEKEKQFRIEHSAGQHKNCYLDKGYYSPANPCKLCREEAQRDIEFWRHF